MRKYLLNIQRATIHNGIHPCVAARKMKESNKKWFDTYQEAENYYEGKTRSGVICGNCFKSIEEAINL